MNSGKFTKGSAIRSDSFSRSCEQRVMQRVTSNELLAGQRELVIEHGAEEYRLRITSKDKLILTK